MNIEWDSSVGSDIRRILQERFDEVAFLFPRWCEKLTVFFEPVDKEGDNILMCNPKHEYRVMSVTVFPTFLQTSDWENPLIHEIQHGLLRPYIAKVDRLIEKFIKDETVIEFLNDEMSEAEEAVCEDLTTFALKLKQSVRAQLEAELLSLQSRPQPAPSPEPRKRTQKAKKRSRKM